MADFEIIEHTADVGVEARAETLEELFAQATLGLLSVIGAFLPGQGTRLDVRIEARDLGGLLVDWLNEILYLQDARDQVVTDLDVRAVDQTPSAIDATLALRQRTEELEGTAVKAVTFHGLVVEPRTQGWFARVYVDV